MREDRQTLPAHGGKRQIVVESSEKKERYDHLLTISFFVFVVRPAGFEPAAYGFEEQESCIAKSI